MRRHLTTRSRALGSLGAALLLGATVAVLPTLSAGAAGGPVTLGNGWTYTDLGEMSPTSSVALSINDGGRVVGYTLTVVAGVQVYRGVEFTSGAAVPLGPTSGTAAFAINDSGTVVGQKIGLVGDLADNKAIRFAGTAAGIETELGSGVGDFMAQNNAGTAVGAAVFGDTVQAASFPGVASVDLDSSEGSEVSTATAVNAGGTIVGIKRIGASQYVGARFDADAETPIDPDQLGFLPAGINDAGTMVGTLTSASQAAIFSGGVTTDLGLFPGGGGWVLNDINNGGTAVGLAHVGTQSTGVIRHPDGSVEDILNDTGWLPDSLGWSDAELKSINDDGSIVGYVTGCPEEGSCLAHAIRLDPPSGGTTSTSSSSTSSTVASTTSSTVASTTSSTGATTTSSTAVTSTSSSSTSSTVAPTTSSTGSSSSSSSSSSSTTSTGASSSSSSSSSSSTTSTLPTCVIPTTIPGAATSSTAPCSPPTSGTTPSTVDGSGSSSSSTVPGATGAALALSSTSVVRGGSIIVSGTGFDPGATVDVELHSTPIDLTTLTARIDGSFTATITIPASAEVGSHLVVATATDVAGDTVTASAALNVTASLPKTGTDVGEWTLLALFALGVGLLAFGRSHILAAREG